MKWFVQIRGENSALEKLSKSLNSRELSVTQEKQAFFLKSTDFDSLKNENDVRKIAGKKLLVLNGILKLNQKIQKPLILDRVVKENDDGTRQGFIFLSGIAEAVSVVDSPKLSVVGRDGTVEEPHQADPILSLFAIAQKDEVVTEVLRIFGNLPHNWFNFYKICEKITADVGSIQNIERKGCAKKKSIELFKWTANSLNAIGDESRHGVQKKKLPPNPMKFSEAKSLIKTLIFNWLSSKKMLNSRPTSQ